MIECEAFFLPSDTLPHGHRFCIFTGPGCEPPRGLVVHVHAFAEELNKSRRMTACQARALAQAGFAVLQIDLLGCGDSAGDFGDASWIDWVSDVVRGVQWLCKRHPSPKVPLWLWGHRAGCLLAVEAAGSLVELGQPACNLLFWNPVSTGKAVMQQQLRLRLAGGLIGGQPKGAVEALRAELRHGRHLNVAGYRLGPALATGLDQATLDPPFRPGHLVWLDVASTVDAGPSPAVATITERWHKAGWTVHTGLVSGPQFWQTTEIEDAPQLISTTASGLLNATAVLAAVGSS